MDKNQPAIEVSSKLAYLQPGMYIVRLASEAPGNVITLYPTPVGHGTVDFFPGDGVVRNTLAKVGDCVIVRVKAALGSLLITEFHKAGQQQQMKLKIDRVATEGFEDKGSTQDALSGSAQGAAVAMSGTSGSPTNKRAGSGAISIRQIGHVQGVGDVVVQDDWLGDPLGDERLEGFAINTKGLPAGVTLTYGVLIEGLRSYAAAVAGQFIGTRQKAKALQGVMFDLTGPHAEQFRLSGQVVFAGDPPLAIEPGIQLSGSSGTEHLVAFRLIIEPIATRSSAATAWDDPAVTRIVRQPPAAAQKASVKSAPAKKASAKKIPSGGNKT